MKTKGWLLALVLVGASATAASMRLQDALLYFPDRAVLSAMVGGSLVPWPATGEFRGLVAEPRKAARATVIVFHGNAGHAGHRAYYAQALVPLGLRVILAEYPGYGPRSGALGEEAFVADAAETIDMAYRRHGAPLLIIGESLGAGVAAAASARRHEHIAGLLLITPWDRLENIANHHYAWLPVRWLLRDRYDSAANLARFDRPVVVTVAERDTIVPARFGIALHEALRAPKRLLKLPDVGHNDWIDSVDERWWREIVGFLLDGARMP